MVKVAVCDERLKKIVMICMQGLLRVQEDGVSVLTSVANDGSPIRLVPHWTINMQIGYCSYTTIYSTVIVFIS